MTHTYICVLGGEPRAREKGECKKIDIISNRESDILLSRIFYWVVGSWGVTLTILCIMYHVLISSMELPFFKKMWTQIQGIKQAFRCFLQIFFFFFLIGIHSMQGWPATTRHGVTRKKSTTKITVYRKCVWKEPTVKRSLLLLDLKPLRS